VRLLRKEDVMEKKKILLIDDEKDLCALTEKLLEKMSDYEVDIATNGSDGLTMAKALRPDLIVLDIVMPGMDGFEVLEELKKDTSLAEVPVVILSGKGDEASRRKALELYNEMFLIKPVTALQLKEKIDEVFKMRMRK